MQKVDFFTSPDSLTMTSTTAKTAFDALQRRCALSVGDICWGDFRNDLLMLQPYMLNH